MADDAAEVADDYRQALEDLSVNSRIEIATLTNIARENANHGLAIAEVLQNHIKKVPPPKTLPALYVLDSVVKNVPTPYSLYFGPKLYSIFMNAYTKVDKDTRRKMDEMLRTWKEPVPGSISTKPVFPPEVVRPIEHALIAARNVAFVANHNSFQGQQQLLRGARPPARETPTPPTGRSAPHAGLAQGQRPSLGQASQMPPQSMAQQPYPMRPHNDPNMQQQQQQQQQQQHRPTPQPAPAQMSMPHYPQHQPQPGLGSEAGYGPPPQGISIERLKDDIQQLIVAERTEFARNPLDASRQTRLKALLDLQAIIQRQDMPQDQLMLIKARVAELAVNNLRAAAPADPLTQHHQPPHLPPQQYYPPVGGVVATPTPPQVAALARPPSVTPGAGGGGLSLSALLGQKAAQAQKGSLAALLAAKQSATPPALGGFAPPPATSTPPQAYQANFPPAAVPLPAAVRSPSLPQGPPFGQPPAVQPSPVLATDAIKQEAKPNTVALLAMLRQKGLLKTDAAAKPKKQAYHSQRFSQASLKQHRPHLTPLFYDDLGAPCTQCGRRFRPDAAGRRQKTAHMDWHFRVHQRLADSEKRGLYRSYYVDEMDWIQTPLTGDADYAHATAATTTAAAHEDQADAGGSGGGGQKQGGRKQLQQLQYLAVPDDGDSAEAACPICQERFEMKWLDEAQEWVWMDAVRLGGRVFHASCHREVAGEGPGVEGVLGKRKAEDDFQSVRKVAMGGY
ncbi:hypothetical protein B0T18DRAFT_204234 [Schizothecium vesticola]|uniref:CID domain-containing protein n=1 Tax=Schizothecium vesticola TaxID=314040 RepID=A0AA40EJ04_9PEZI|nr:hypothetical protein B0T18DRAFT_204234 [Schizothecium vesticola]